MGQLDGKVALITGASIEDIAPLAPSVASDAARNVSGQCIAVTAGEPAV